MTARVLITCPPMLKTLDSCQERFEKEGLEVVAPEIEQQLSEEELCELITDVDGVIAGDDPYSERVLSIGKEHRLRTVAKWGIGVDAIDLEAAKRLGIPVSNTPDVFGEEVADVAIGYTIMLTRALHHIDAAVRSGDWLKIRGVSLQGKVAGVIGVGSIGKAIVRRLSTMGMQLYGYDVRDIPETYCTEQGLEQVPLDKLLSESDLVIVACVLTRDNKYLLDERAFYLMKQNAYLVNISRGMLVKESALLHALESGKLAGAALDVFESEPLATDNPLCAFKNVILGSHNGSNTHEAVMRVNQLAIDNLVRDLAKAG